LQVEERVGRSTAPGDTHLSSVESPKDANKTPGQSKTRRPQEAFTSHLRPLGGPTTQVHRFQTP